jgi:phosphoribosylamine-glycine ligase
MDTTDGPRLRILILGSGGREHALAWKLSRDERVTDVVVAPGNAGTKTKGKMSKDKIPQDKISSTLDAIPINRQDNFKDLLAWAKDMKFNLVIPGDQRLVFEGLGELFKKGKQNLVVSSR